MRKSFMRNLGLTGLTAALLLTGCAGTSSGNKTQEITDTTITASEAQSQEGSQSALNTSGDASGTDGALSSDTSSEGQNAAASQAASQTSLSDIVTGDQAKDEETYYQVKAEKDAVEIDIENLEASFRIGTISQEDFTSQKADLKTQEDYLDAQEEILEDSLDLAYRKSNPALPEGTAEELFSQKQNLEAKGDELDRSEDELELSYRSGDIIRKDFISKQTELIRQKEELDREEELVERALEKMGYDD